ncbi:MAG: Bug family tripartite tricarboxylate transporter substrate binding protein [Burkholderiales bacterium]
MIVESAGASAGAAKSDTAKPLAVTPTERLPNYPDLPTVSETLPGFAPIAWVALVAPSSTPANLVAKINDHLRAALGDPGLLRRFQELGAIARPITLAQTKTFIRAEEQAWRPVVRQMGMRAR